MVIVGFTIISHLFICFSFLLDRLLQYEKLDDSSDDSDLTASSDSDHEAHKTESGSLKR